MYPPDDATLAAALYVTHASEAPLKGGLFVLAMFALLSGNPKVRTPLFVSMALVPPINVAFHFRVQGFPMVRTAIGTTLSAILWGSLFLTSESVEASLHTGAARTGRLGRLWFGLSTAVLTSLGLVSLLSPKTALSWHFPCLGSTFEAHRGELAAWRSACWLRVNIWRRSPRQAGSPLPAIRKVERCDRPSHCRASR